MSQREADGDSCLLELAAQPITVALEDSGPPTERMAKVFPWMLGLSSADRESCAQELVNATRVRLSTGQSHLTIAELTSRKETAAAVAGPDSTDLEWLNDENGGTRSRGGKQPEPSLLPIHAAEPFPPPLSAKK